YSIHGLSSSSRDISYCDVVG
ncbi:unnamed protein product, partial [Rotaria sordida]